MQCIIVSSKNKQKFKKVQSITLPAFSGELQVLPDHAESFIALRQGKIILKSDKVNTIPIENGICDIKDNIVTIIL